MSLHQLAQQIQANGRGNDTQLVHMAPAEVRAMRKLAQQHGGDLTINPRTGLPEAGFLEQILPTVVGAGVGIMTANPMLGAAAGGAMGMAMNKGSIQSGLMAGLGAYGMSSLGAGLMATGAESLATAPEAMAGALGVPGAATGPGSQAAMLAQQNAGMGLEGIESVRSAAGTAQGAMPSAAPSTFDQLQAGYKGTKLDMDFLKKNMFPIGMAAAPLLMGASSSSNNQNQQDEANKGYIRPYTFSQTRNPNYTGAGTPYFNQSMTAQAPIPAADYGAQPMPFAAEGGIMRTQYMADGGIADIPTSSATPVKKVPVLADFVAAANKAGTPAMTAQYVNPQQRYTAPVNQVPQAVTDYNNILAQRAQQEYVVQPQLSAMVPQHLRPAPVAYKAPNLTSTTSEAPQKTELQKLQDQIDAMNSQQQNMYTGNYYGTGGGDGGAAGAAGAAGDGGSAGAGEGGNGGSAFAMGGGIGTNYDGTSRFNHGPEYPMQQPQNFAYGGGISNLGGYSDGGRLLRGPGDGVSDDIPAQIGDKQPARLADGEFVIPARIVSELGNGSTDAGAKRLYAMMDRVQANRSKTVGKGKVAVNSKSDKYLPA
jgi:hypothetical protein